MPESTPRNYLEATHDYGAKIDLQPTIAAAFAEIKRFESEGRIFVHPFDDSLTKQYKPCNLFSNDRKF